MITCMDMQLESIVNILYQLIDSDISPIYNILLTLGICIFTIFFSVWMAIRFSLRNLSRNVKKLEKNLYALFNPYILTYEAPMQELISLCHEINYKVNNYDKFMAECYRVSMITNKLGYDGVNDTSFYLTPNKISFNVTKAVDKYPSYCDVFETGLMPTSKPNNRSSVQKLSSIPVISVSMLKLKNVKL